MAKQSLVSQSLPQLPQLPSVWEGGKPEESRFGSAYATFVSVRSKSYPDWVAAIPGLKEPDAILVLPAPAKPVRLDPFRFCYVGGKQYWAVINDVGDTLEAYPERPCGKKTTEVIESVLLILHNDTVQAARCTFKSTKCPAAKTAAIALKDAIEDEDGKWSKQSDKHLATMKCPQGYLRFTATVTCTNRTARGSGFTYWQSAARIEPTGPAEWKVLAAYLENSLDDFNKVVEAYTQRLEAIKGLMK